MSQPKFATEDYVLSALKTHGPMTMRDLAKAAHTTVYYADFLCSGKLEPLVGMLRAENGPGGEIVKWWFLRNDARREKLIEVPRIQYHGAEHLAAMQLHTFMLLLTQRGRLDVP
jgi:hypothetical protein